MPSRLTIAVALLGIATMSQRALSQPRVPPPDCSQVAALQERFSQLTQQIDIDRQVLRNFDFLKTVDEIQQAADLPLQRVEQAREEFRKLLFDVALESVGDRFLAGVSLTREESDALKKLQPFDTPSGEALVTRDVALEALARARSGYDLGSATRQREMLDAAVSLADMAWSAAAAAGKVATRPAFSSVLLSADAWAWYQVYQSIYAVQTVNLLTRVNEGDLTLLKSRSEKLTTEVQQLRGVRSQLESLATQCSSVDQARGTGWKRRVVAAIAGAAVGTVVALVTIKYSGLSDVAKTVMTDNSSAGYYFANWNCNNQAQCISVMGFPNGSAGPFCSRPPCDAWRQSYFQGATCDGTNKYVIRNKPSGLCQS